jgi:hypothetical protein
MQHAQTSLLPQSLSFLVSPQVHCHPLSRKGTGGGTTTSSNVPPSLLIASLLEGEDRGSAMCQPDDHGQSWPLESQFTHL